jgi:hypothetical protein
MSGNVCSFRLRHAALKRACVARARPQAELLAQQRSDVVRLRVPAKHRLREDKLAVDVDVEDPICARYDLKHPDHVLPVLQ